MVSELAAERTGRLYQFWDLMTDRTIECDAVIVGSGAGGATVAAELAEAGLAVAVLEEGGFYDTRTFHAGLFDAVAHLYRDAGTERAVGPPNVMLFQGRCVGGSTVINGGMCWRTPARVLERWTRERGLPAVGPEAMQPLFERLEALIHVAPQEPGSIGMDDGLLRLGAERLGYKVVANRRNQLHCVGSNNCVFGCPTGAKQSMLVSMLPRAVGFGADIYADCRVERLVLERAGPDGRPRAVGVQARVLDPDPRAPARTLTVRARHVVLACGAIQTPLLLLGEGLANGSGQLGRNLAVHPNAKAIALFDEPVVGWQGVHQAHQIHEFLEEGIVMAVAFLPPQLLALTQPLLGNALFELMRQINHMVCAGILVEDTTTGTVRRGPFGRAAVRYRMSDYDLEQVLRGLALLAEVYFAAGAREVLLPIYGLEPLRSPDEIPRLFRHPVHRHDLEIAAFHPLGTCRMGVHPGSSVVDPFGQVHEVAGLWIADASVLPGPIGVNPMLTIMALALRTALRIRGAW
ncbi:MAG: hypothetical protein KatS3mg102_1624 [Planctomycetota bacterium]|nr:MAG: hypothetical protein KatS3mg102_1624 [Planctomycetota bacterium]